MTALRWICKSVAVHANAQHPRRPVLEQRFVQKPHRRRRTLQQPLKKAVESVEEYGSHRRGPEHPIQMGLMRKDKSGRFLRRVRRVAQIDGQPGLAVLRRFYTEDDTLDLNYRKNVVTIGDWERLDVLVPTADQPEIPAEDHLCCGDQSRGDNVLRRSISGLVRQKYMHHRDHNLPRPIAKGDRYCTHLRSAGRDADPVRNHRGNSHALEFELEGSRFRSGPDIF